LKIFSLILRNISSPIDNVRVNNQADIA